jgi:hypothetical protein
MPDSSGCPENTPVIPDTLAGPTLRRPGSPVKPRRAEGFRLEYLGDP